MSIYYDVLDRCATCSHFGYMHTTSQGVRMHCVAVTRGKRCDCSKFKPAAKGAQG